MEEGANHGTQVTNDCRREPVVVGVGRRGVVVSLLEWGEKRTGCCLEVDGEERKNLISVRPRNLQVGEVEVRASQVERWEVRN